jgi:hypothetical protein
VQSCGFEGKCEVAVPSSKQGFAKRCGSRCSVSVHSVRRTAADGGVWSIQVHTGPITYSILSEFSRRSGHELRNTILLRVVQSLYESSSRNVSLGASSEMTWCPGSVLLHLVSVSIVVSISACHCCDSPRETGVQFPDRESQMFPFEWGEVKLGRDSVFAF